MNDEGDSPGIIDFSREDYEGLHSQLIDLSDPSVSRLSLVGYVDDVNISDNFVAQVLHLLNTRIWKEIDLSDCTGAVHLPLYQIFKGDNCEALGIPTLDPNHYGYEDIHLNLAEFLESTTVLETLRLSGTFNLTSTQALLESIRSNSSLIELCFDSSFEIRKQKGWKERMKRFVQVILNSQTIRTIELIFRFSFNPICDFHHCLLDAWRHCPSATIPRLILTPYYPDNYPDTRVWTSVMDLLNANKIQYLRILLAGGFEEQVTSCFRNNTSVLEFEMEKDHQISVTWFSQFLTAVLNDNTTLKRFKLTAPNVTDDAFLPHITNFIRYSNLKIIQFVEPENGQITEQYLSPSREHQTALVEVLRKHNFTIEVLDHPCREKFACCGWDQDISWILRLNKGGRRILRCNNMADKESPIFDGLWPLILERINKLQFEDYPRQAGQAELLYHFIQEGPILKHGRP